MKEMTLHFEEIEAMEAPLEWWQHATYAIAAAAGLVAIAAT